MIVVHVQEKRQLHPDLSKHGGYQNQHNDVARKTIEGNDGKRNQREQNGERETNDVLAHRAGRLRRVQGLAATHASAPNR